MSVCLRLNTEQKLAWSIRFERFYTEKANFFFTDNLLFQPEQSLLLWDNKVLHGTNVKF